MNCSGCGTPLKEGTAHCSNCGRTVLLNDKNMQRERVVIASPSKNRGLKAALVILSCALVLCIGAMAVYFCSKAGLFEVKNCPECNVEFRGNSELCEKCTIEELNAKECGMCDGKHKNDSILCDDCLGEIDESAYSGAYYCIVCNEAVERENVTFVSDAGFVFCGKCDDDYTCYECERLFKIPDIAYEGGKKKYCYECYEEMVVSECGSCHADILYDSEYKKVEETFYCMECYRELPRGSCTGCGETIYIDDDYYGTEGRYCCKNCYSGVCRICDKILIGTDYQKIDGRYYCPDCSELQN